MGGSPAARLAGAQHSVHYRVQPASRISLDIAEFRRLVRDSSIAHAVMRSDERATQTVLMPRSPMYDMRNGEVCAAAQLCTEAETFEMMDFDLLAGALAPTKSVHGVSPRSRNVQRHAKSI